MMLAVAGKASPIQTSWGREAQSACRIHLFLGFCVLFPDRVSFRCHSLLTRPSMRDGMRPYRIRYVLLDGKKILHVCVIGGYRTCTELDLV